MWGAAYSRPATEPERESDDDLRERLRYVGAWPKDAVDKYTGQALDDLAWRFSLRRRGT